MHVPLASRAWAIIAIGTTTPRTAAVVAAATAWLAFGIGPAAALPEIRITRDNRVPACVTPDRLMRFLTSRNSRLDPRFRDIARFYRQHGEALRVRWDYAFFQMVIETNYLTYRRPDGRWGDVDPAQNNFAGIGTTGGGVPGDRFKGVSSGVLGQMQHLVAYSGEYVAEPVAPRTALKQDAIIALSRQLQRPVRFSDLARRWAVDPRYGSSIEYIATTFRSEHCGRQDKQAREVLPWRQSAATTATGAPARELAAPSHLGAEPQLQAAPVAAVRPRQIARTIWRRGETAEPSNSATAAAQPLLVATPAPARRAQAIAPGDVTAKDRDDLASLAARAASTAAAVETPSRESSLIAGLSAIASSIGIATAAPPPRVATRFAP
ncbi:MAG: hypothetical protein ACK4MF_01070 [Hyphomicrobiaceae bacterium]